jgi:hypothetical protein
MRGHTIRNEDGPVRGTATKRGSDDVYRGIEHESFEAQATMFRMFPYLREQHPELARQHGYEV